MFQVLHMNSIVTLVLLRIFLLRSRDYAFEFHATFSVLLIFLLLLAK